MTDPVDFWQVFCNGLIYAYLRKKSHSFLNNAYKASEKINYALFVHVI